MFLAGCSEQTEQPNNSSLNAQGSNSNSQSETDSKESSDTESSTESSKAEESSDTESSVDAEALSINDDVVWGLRKTLDELKQKYGDVTGGSEGQHIFKNGYGLYVFEGGDTGVCKIIDGIKAKDFLTGEFSVLNYEELANRAGITYWHVDGDEPAPMDNCWWAYFTHPSYRGVTFAVYSQTKRDEVKGDTGIQLRLGDPETLIGPSDYNG